MRHGKGEVRALAAANASEERLVVVGAIDHHVGIDAALSREAELLAGALHLHRGREDGEILKAPAVDGQVANSLLIERLAGVGFRDLRKRG